MKKMLSTIAALSMTLSFVSCSSDEPAPQSEQETIVSFAISLPDDLQTRATFGEVADINNIKCYVYRVTGENNENLTQLYYYNLTPNFDDKGTYHLEVHLMKKFKYRFAFYATNTANTNVEYSNGVLSVKSYNNLKPNDNMQDVFVASTDVITVDEVAPTDYHDIQLKRVFAQLNWGTAGIREMKEAYANKESDTDSDVTATSSFDMTATVSITNGLYTKYDILKDEVVESSNVTSPVTFTAVDCNNLPDVDFPVNGYDLVAMNYILVGKGEGTDTGTIDCSVTFNWTDNGEAQTRTTAVNSAPCKANCRTNIYGNLITTPTNFQCTIQTKFENDQNDITGDNLNFSSGE